MLNCRSLLNIIHITFPVGSVSRIECLRLLLAHLVLPIEKFGIVFGVVVGAIYWPIALPLCMLVAVCYGVPTIYLSGRVFVHARPAFLRTPPSAADAAGADDGARRMLSRGVTSFESCMLLENIIPPPSYGRPSPNVSPRCSSRRSCRADLKAVACSVFRSVVLGIACLLFLFPLLVMYAESAGFLAEVCALSLMGAVVNASNAAKYVVLAFWVVTYTANCYNTAYAKYVELSSAVFNYIKRKLDDDVRAVTLLRERYQKNTAFKYFTTDELIAATRLETEVNLCADDNNDATTAERDIARATHEDSIEYVDGKLHWRVTDLALFVDQKDVPRMPVALFDRICKIEAPGCPGPVSCSLLQATVQLGYMLAFLAFVFAVVVTFGSAYSVSATNQLLVTLAGGFLPFVVRFVLTARQVALDLNSYTFEGRIHNMIREFSQAWPVYDLAFERDVGPDVQPEAAESDAISPAAQPMRDPTQVDLLITVREDFENVRSASQQTSTQYNGPEEETPGAIEVRRPNARNYSSMVDSQPRGATCHQPCISSEPVANIDRAADVRPCLLRDISRQQADVMVVSDGYGAHSHSEVYRSNSMPLTSVEPSGSANASKDVEDESAV